MKRSFVVVGISSSLALSGCSTTGDVTSPQSESEGAIAARVAPVAFNGLRTYDVTIENLTGGQPFSPGVVVTHMKSVKLFSVGTYATEGLREIAENGNPATAFGELDGASGISDVVATSAPVGCVGCPGPFASTQTIRITADYGADRLSLALMLICTNDGFVRLDRVLLPRNREAVSYYAYGYDAGTEENDELWDSIVDPCGGIGPVAGPQDGTNDRPATDRRITRHQGIRGVGDLSEAHDWKHRVAKVTIQEAQ